jgi:DNA-binding CsgD family transcriptional regulator
MNGCSIVVSSTEGGLDVEGETAADACRSHTETALVKPATSTKPTASCADCRRRDLHDVHARRDAADLTLAGAAARQRRQHLGAAGFLVKSTPPEDLTRLVRVAADGNTVLSPAAARRLVAASADQHSAHLRARKLLESLTEREVDVLACLGEGLSNAQIAARLYLSEATVKSYVSRMLDKLGCANRTQAGLLAYDAGIVGR